MVVRRVYTEADCLGASAFLFPLASAGKMWASTRIGSLGLGGDWSIGEWIVSLAYLPKSRGRMLVDRWVGGKWQFGMRMA